MLMRRAGQALAGLVVCSVVASGAWAGDSLYGRVTEVAEGGLVTLDYGSGSYPIRLVGIDVPRPGEPQGEAARQLVAGLVLGKNARMRLARRGENGELVCRLFTDDPALGIKEVGVELVRAGLARRRPDYDEKYGELAKAEDEARAAHRGLWATAR